MISPNITPWPLGPGCSRVAVLGGSFDPPHRAHMTLARTALDHLGPNSGVVFVPAAASPFKVGRSASSAADRLAMVRLAVAGEPRWGVWSDEIDRAAAGEASYTIDTLRRAITVTNGQVGLCLVLGSDQALRFHEWKSARELLAIAPPLVRLRPPIGSVEALRTALGALGEWNDEELAMWVRQCVSASLDDVSSTRVRSVCAAEGPGAIREMVGGPVADYIGGRGLYGSTLQ